MSPATPANTTHPESYQSYVTTLAAPRQCQRASRVPARDVHGNGIPNGTGNPMGMGIKHRIGNGREWETSSVGMGITCTPMGIYSKSFYAAMSLLSTMLARCQCILCRVCRLPKCNLFCPACGSVHTEPEYLYRVTVRVRSALGLFLSLQ